MSPIRLSYDSRCTANALGDAGTWRPLTVCDHCDERIEKAGNCSVEHHDSGDLAFCHKTSRCNDRYRASRYTLSDDGWGWMEMRDFLSFVSSNLV